MAILLHLFLLGQKTKLHTVSVTFIVRKIISYFNFTYFVSEYTTLYPNLKIRFFEFALCTHLLWFSKNLSRTCRFDDNFMRSPPMP